MKGLLGENVTIPVLATAEEFFRTVQGCRFTIAVRLHASVLSCCAGVPPLMLGYRDKCLDFMESMDLADWHVSLTDAEPGEITAKARLLEGKCGEMREPVWNRARHWQAALRKYVESVPC
jgi:polysaccharide pyruvyl transferase WcaK-like protein